MPYNGNPAASPTDAIRFWLQDTSASAELLNDSEIRYFMDYAGSYTDDPLLLAAGLCSVIGAKYAGEVTITGDGITYSGEQLQQKYTQLAEELRSTWRRLNGNRGFPYAGGVDYFEWTSRFNRRPPLFEIGMNDNPRGADQMLDHHHIRALEEANDYYGTASYFEGG